MQTTFNADDGEKVSFYWKVSSEEYGDFLKLYIDNNYQEQISGDVDWQKKSYTLSGSGQHTLKWEYSKNSSGSDGEDCGWVDGLLVGTGKLYPTPDEKSEALDSNLKFTESGEGSWYIESGTQADYYYDGDAMIITGVDASEEGHLHAIVDSDSSETIKFYWKISGGRKLGTATYFFLDMRLFLV